MRKPVFRNIKKRVHTDLRSLTLPRRVSETGVI